MTREDINDIINAICPNDEDYEKPCISPKYLRQELEQLALDQRQWNEEPTTKNDLGVDTVSRKAVLNTLERMDKALDEDRMIEAYKELLIACYHDLPSVTPQEPRWISVKDRLPKKGEYGDVLVTFVPPAGTLWATVMIARYSDLMGIAPPCFHIGEVGKESFENITPQVTAWMPLPQPYREVEE